MSESFVFYQSFREAIRMLPPEERLEVFEAITDYGLYGECEEPDSPVAKAILTMAIPQMDANSKRRDGAKQGGRPSKKPMVSEKSEKEKPMVSEKTKNEKPMVSQINENEKPMVLQINKNTKPMVSEKSENEKPNVNDNVNVNVNVNEKENVKGDCKGGTGKRFTPPSIDQIREYCRERGNHVDPEGFYAFYESNGWKVGKNPMKDWRAAVRTWERRDRETAPKKKKNTFHDFQQRDYDYDALEEALMGRTGG